MNDLKELPDGAEIGSFTINVTPATKKNHSRLVVLQGKPRILPSEAYVKFEKAAKADCLAFKSQIMGVPDFGVEIEAKVFLRDRRWMGDHCGYLQAIGDTLQKHGVIVNDKYISFALPPDGWLHFDKDHARVELVLRRRRHPAETE